jgi:hypothetical protein
VSLLNYLAADLSNMLGELPIVCKSGGKEFVANRSTYRRDNSLQDGGFLNSAAMVITAAYDSTTQAISLGDRIEINGSPFRVISADLAQDAVSVDFQLEDVNR